MLQDTLLGYNLGVLGFFCFLLNIIVRNSKILIFAMVPGSPMII